VYSASPETIRREPLEFDLRRSVGNQQDQLTDNTSLGSTVSSASIVRMADRILLGARRKSQITQDRRLRFLHFLCTLCAEYAFPCYEIVPRPPLHGENLRDNGLIAGSLEALSVPGVLSKIGGRDFLHCTNLMELTAQGFTRTVSITLAMKMQSQIPENISD
jgi:hypothetical protein